MKEPIIKTQDVEYTYEAAEGSPATQALRKVSVEIEKGSFVVVLGRNGSGKSTFARLINALLLPSAGTVYVKGLSSSDEQHLWEIRSLAGMVFQNPDNQIVGTTVEEDVAFGPENLGVEPQVIRQRVDEALSTVGMAEYAKHGPHLLSGGQKQRVAIAGILAMQPECILLDEATSMLDPVGRRELMGVLKRLNTSQHITIVHITHHMDEVSWADRVLVVDKGQLVLDGAPQEVFARVEPIKALGLDVPQVTELFEELQKEGISMPRGVLDVDTAVEALKEAMVMK